MQICQPDRAFSSHKQWSKANHDYAHKPETQGMRMTLKIFGLQLRPYLSVPRMPDKSRDSWEQLAENTTALIRKLKSAQPVCECLVRYTISSKLHCNNGKLPLEHSNRPWLPLHIIHTLPTRSSSRELNGHASQNHGERTSVAILSFLRKVRWTSVSVYDTGPSNLEDQPCEIASNYGTEGSAASRQEIMLSVQWCPSYRFISMTLISVFGRFDSFLHESCQSARHHILETNTEHYGDSNGSHGFNAALHSAFRFPREGLDLVRKLTD